MPEWLAVLLGVWGAMLPIIMVMLRMHFRIKDQFDRMAEHFEPDSEIARTVGTIPQRIKALYTEVESVKDQVTKVDHKVDELTRIVKGA